MELLLWKANELARARSSWAARPWKGCPCWPAVAAGWNRGPGRGERPAERPALVWEAAAGRRLGQLHASPCWLDAVTRSGPLRAPPGHRRFDPPAPTEDSSRLRRDLLRSSQLCVLSAGNWASVLWYSCLEASHSYDCLTVEQMYDERSCGVVFCRGCWQRRVTDG